jgi:hypothetical protein
VGADGKFCGGDRGLFDAAGVEVGGEGADLAVELGHGGQERRVGFEAEGHDVLVGIEREGLAVLLAGWLSRYLNPC